MPVPGAPSASSAFTRSRSENAETPTATRLPPFSPEELAAFKAQVTPLIGLDLEAYKPRQIERRIAAMFFRAGVRSLPDYLALLASDQRRLAEFVDGVTINVSEFFRNPERWEVLETEILPWLLERLAPQEQLVVWSAGCSMGAELYSVGVLLEQLGQLDRATLIGTDLDRKSVERARAGLYGAHELKAVDEARMGRYFKPEGNQMRFVAPAIQARATFMIHNLLTDPPPCPCHLILCRNVVIYLGEAGKNHLYRTFQQALVPGGVLFVGGTERIFTHQELGYELRSPFFYQKPVEGR